MWDSAAAWAGFGEWPVWKGPNYVGFDVVKPSCPVNCRFTSDKSQVLSADAIIFELQAFGKENAYSFLEEPLEIPEMLEHQQRIHFAYETELYFPLIGYHQFLDFMTLNMTFDHRTSQIPITFACDWANYTLADLLKIPSADSFSDNKFAATMVSNCGRGGAEYRTKYFAELMKYIPVDNYGKCLQTKKVKKKKEQKDLFCILCFA